MNIMRNSNPYSCCGIIILIFAILYSYTLKKQEKEIEDEPINRESVHFETFSRQSEEQDYDDIPRYISMQGRQQDSRPMRRLQAKQQIKYNLSSRYREVRRQNEAKQRIMDMYSQNQMDYDDDSEEEEEVSGFKEIKDIELSVCLLSDTLNIRDPYAQMNKLKNIYNKLFLVRFLNQFSGLLYHINLFSVKYYRIKISEYSYFYGDEYFNRGQETKIISLDELILLTKKELKFSLRIEQYLIQTKEMDQYYDDRRQFMKDRQIIKLMWSMLEVNYHDRLFPLGHRKRVLERLIAFKNGQSTVKYQNDLKSSEPSDAEIVLVTFFNLITVATKHETKKYKDTKLVLYYKLFDIKIIDKYEYDQLFTSRKLAPKAEDKYFVLQREYASDISIHFYSAQISQIIKNFRKDEQETLLQGFAGNDNVYLALYYYILSLKVYGLRRLDQMEKLHYDTHFLLWILDFTKRI
ncbi:hypothetical protein pb186bvf_015634 [Paramecium bursaria]